MLDLTIRIALAFTVLAAPVATQAPGMTPGDPLAIARVLAGRYPAQPIMSYIPALSWSGSLRLTALTGEAPWREKAMKDMQAFISGQTPAIAEPYRLTSLAGHLALADAGRLDHNDAARGRALVAAAFVTARPPAEGFRFTTGWTDDMFMLSSVISRTATAEQATQLGAMLITYANKLQRPDGLFIHAPDGPHAWGAATASRCSASPKP